MEPHGSLRPHISVTQQHDAFVNFSYIFQPDCIFSLLKHLRQMFLHQDFLHSFFHTGSDSPFLSIVNVPSRGVFLSPFSKAEDPHADLLATMLLEKIQNS